MQVDIFSLFVHIPDGIEDETEDEPTIRIIIPRGIGFENVIGGINFVIYE